MDAQGSYEYFDHDADVGVVGRGESVEAAFVAAAGAMFALTCDIDAIDPRERVDVAFDEPDAEFALVTWLNALLSAAGERGMALGRFELSRRGEHWQGSAWGEAWRDGLERRTQVKGATLTMLGVTEHDGRWEARCVVDV